MIVNETKMSETASKKRRGDTNVEGIDKGGDESIKNRGVKILKGIERIGVNVGKRMRKGYQLRESKARKIGRGNRRDSKKIGGKNRNKIKYKFIRERLIEKIAKTRVRETEVKANQTQRAIGMSFKVSENVDGVDNTVGGENLANHGHIEAGGTRKVQFREKGLDGLLVFSLADRFKMVQMSEPKNSSRIEVR
jgi:hypothetical protein